MEKSCKNCVYRNNYYCTKIGDEIQHIYDESIDLLDDTLNCTKLAEGIVDKLYDNDMLDTYEWFTSEIEKVVEEYLAERFSELPEDKEDFKLKDLDNDFYCKHWR